MFFNVRALIAILALALAGAVVQAGPRWQQNSPEYGQRNGHSQRSVNDVIGEVENRYGGKVVGVQQAQQGENSMYRVRVLQRNGRVKTIMVPADRRR